jgi:N-formylmaleamate deformylase
MLPHWTHNDLLVNGVQMHYYRTGRGDKRPLVLVHGFSDNGLCWAPTACDLEAEYDVIMPDMRGHGLSARVRSGEPVDMAADLAGLIRALGLQRPVVGGHSMGGMITFQIGVRFPELASALVLEDPPFWVSRPVQTPPPGQPAENPMAKWAKSLPGKTMAELLAEYHAEHPTWSEAFVHNMCESKKQLDPMIVDTMIGRLNIDAPNWLTSIQNITLPTLLFTANPALGAIVTPEAAAKVRELNPNVAIVNIPNVGHLIRFDNYPAFMQALRAFLKQVSP